ENRSHISVKNSVDRPAGWPKNRRSFWGDCRPGGASSCVNAPADGCSNTELSFAVKQLLWDVTPTRRQAAVLRTSIRAHESTSHILTLQFLHSYPAPL